MENKINNTPDTDASAADSTAAAPSAKESKPKDQGIAAELYDWLEVIAVSVAIVFFVFAFLFRVAVVDGGSMNRTLTHADKLIVREMLYTPRQGDIIVCQSEYFGYDTPIVKRVIATEGQTISFDYENWIVYVDGKPVNTDAEGHPVREDYVNFIQGVPMRRMQFDAEPYTVPEGHIFVMGDNRNNSTDSRMAGPIDTRLVIGKVVLRFYPFGEFRFFGL